MTPNISAVSMPLVNEVANASSGAELRNDVQLAQFRSEKNLELAREFIFTRKAAAGRKFPLSS